MGREKIIVALDVATAAEAWRIISEVGDLVGGFKIGLQLFTAAGPAFVRELVQHDKKIFLDVKFHDIPNTVAKAAAEVARLGVWMFNIHALGGGEMMQRTIDEVREVCESENLRPPLVIGVTVLTSSDAETLRETGIAGKVDSQVVKLARLSAEYGLDGVVASPHEIEGVRDAVEKKDFVIVTPGIRPDFATNNDQKRVMTPGQASRLGADYLIIGRPITGATDRAAVVEKIIEELED